MTTTVFCQLDKMQSLDGICLCDAVRTLGKLGATRGGQVSILFFMVLFVDSGCDHRKRISR